MRIDLEYKPRDWQKVCHGARRRFTVLALHRRAGKTELAIMELIDAALRFQHSLGLFFYVAPFLKQAKMIAWARLKQRVAKLDEVGACEINESELSVTFKHNGAVIRMYGADNPDGMRGVRLDGAVIDEVAQIKPEVWNDIIQPALSDRKGWALFIGTPRGVNLFSELYFKGQNTPEWYSALFTVYDTDALDPVEIERLRRDMSETSFAREYLCDFSAAGEDQLISLGELEEACQRKYTAADLLGYPRVLGVDVARFGNDRSVIAPRQGLQLFGLDVMHGVDNMQLAGRIASRIDGWGADAVFIDVGGGQGVIDRLRQLGYQNVIEVNFGSTKVIDPRYANRRTEMAMDAAAWVRMGGAIPNSVTLKQDMATPTYSYDSLNRIVLESKDDTKKRLLRSPDEFDAAMLTFAAPVEVRKAIDRYRRPTGAHTPRGHNPYDPAVLQPDSVGHDPYA